jgi:hypothetical protein
MAAGETLRDHAGAGRDVQDALARSRRERLDERRAPAGVLAEGQRRTGAVIVRRQPGEELEGMLLARQGGGLGGRGCSIIPEAKAARV